MQIRDPETIRRLVRCEPWVDERLVVDLLARTGALLDGHFELMSGAHSGTFLRFRALGWDTAALRNLALGLARRINGASFSRVLCPSTAGLFLGIPLASALGLPLAVAGMDRHRRPTAELAHGELKAGESLLLVNDFWTTGGTLASLSEIAALRDARAVAACVFGVREPPPDSATIPIHWMLRVRLDCHDPGDCVDERPLIPAIELN